MSKSEKKSRKVRDKSHPIEKIRGEVEHVFERIADNWQEFENTVSEKLPEWVPGFIKPKVDASESDDALEFCVEMPGLESSDISVSVNDGVLVIEGEKTSETEEQKRNYYLKERTQQRYYRSFSLPSDIDDNKVSADYRNGLLTIKVPHKAEEKTNAKKIPVSDGS